MAQARMGRQTPTQSLILPYTETKGMEAVALYNQSGRTAMEWQELLTCDLMAVNDDGLWVHQKFGYSVPRRNGKNEVVAMREFWGLANGEQICHTAHRTTTSRSAWQRLCKILTDAGYVELDRRTKDEIPEKSFHSTKANGLECVELTGGGSIVFRTRTANGGLGEGFDLLVIDEAQEYTTDQESALIYTVSDSANPQTVFCGTPPTTTSAGTVFPKMRTDALAGRTYDTGWAEWGVLHKPANIRDVELWYETNPSMGHHLDERKVRSEIRGDELDFIIQRLGYWFQYSLKSAVSAAEWEELKCAELPELKGKLFAGVKYGHDGNNAALSIAVKTADGRIFVEAIDCQSVRNGNGWILDFLQRASVEKTVVDGANGQKNLADAMQDARIKPAAVLPTVKEIISANQMFETALTARQICHMGQPSLAQAVTNCEHRAIGSNGGFGYRSIKDGVEIALMESMILAYWAAATTKEKRKQRISY
jgi:phage terminase large subunit-like protein